MLMSLSLLPPQTRTSEPNEARELLGEPSIDSEAGRQSVRDMQINIA